MSGGGGGSTISTTAPRIGSFRFQTSAYGRPVARIFGKTRVSANLLWYGDFTAIAHTTTTSSGGGGGKGGGGGGGVTQENTTFTYTAAVLMLIGRGVLPAITKVWRDKEQTTLAALGLSYYQGTGAQTAFPHLTSNHAGEALAYRGLAYAASAALDLGDSASLMQHSFEVEGEAQFSGAIKDANPKDVIAAILAEAGIPAARIGNLTPFSDYCVANGIFVSPAYTEQKPAAECLQRLAQIGNAEVVASEDKLKLVPYSDEAKAGNGANYVPNAAPLFDFNDDDFLAERGEEPVSFEEMDASDAYNVVKLKFFNRAKDYAEDVVEWQDEDNIALYGRRPMEQPIELTEIVDPAVARLVVQNIGQTQLYFRAGYRFKLGPGKADLLEPMDVVAITNARLGLAALPVRIREIEESQDGRRDGFSLFVREFPAGAGSSVLYPSETGNGYTVNYNVDPGNVNPPVILDAPAVITDSGFEVWLAVSGADPNWGGCQVWVATDPGGPYKQVGSIFGAARHGVVHTAQFPAAADPDVVNACRVDLTVSKGTLTGGTQADADRYNTLAWLEGNELISFQTAALTAQYRYDLDDYVRRGVFNTAISAHPVGHKFARLDAAVFRYAYDPILKGSTLYIKLPSFNIFGGGQQDLAAVAAYAHVIGGPIGAPDAPQNFTVQQIGPVLNFRVDPVPYLQLDRVEVRYADPGETNWNNGIPLANMLRGNTDSNGSTPPGAWRFMARAYDLAGNPSKTWAVFDLQVTADTFESIRTQQEAPDWLGVKSNFVVHWTGKLVPKGQNAGSTYAGNEWVDQFCPDPHLICTYTAPEIDKTIDAAARVWGDIVSALGPGETVGTADPRFQVDHRLDAGAYDGYENWAVGVANFRRLTSRLVLDTARGKVWISGMRTEIDKEPVFEEKHGLVIGAAGTAIVFDAVYHNTPEISAFNDGATPRLPTHTADSRTGTTLHLFDTAGAEVGGTGGYRTAGV